MGGNAKRAEPKEDISRRISYAGREREQSTSSKGRRVFSLRKEDVLGLSKNNLIY